MSLTRRDFLIGGAGLAAGASVSVPLLLPKYHVDRRLKRSRVAVLHADQYSQRLDEVLAARFTLFPIDVRGKRVVLKPNLVDYARGDAINTHPLLVSCRGVISTDGRLLRRRGRGTRTST